MENTKLTVSGMSCMGCVNAVKKVLLALSGVAQVEVTLADGQVSIFHDASAVTLETLKATIEDAGYEVKN